MRKEELINLYDMSNTEKKWKLIERAIKQDITEICSNYSKEFLSFAKEQKERAIKEKKYFKLVWHYWLRKIPFLAPMLGRKYLPSKSKEYYLYRTWYYEYLEPVIDIRDNFKNYEYIFGLLADEKSKDVYCDILMARITGNNKYYLGGMINQGIINNILQWIYCHNQIGRRFLLIVEDISGTRQKSL